MENEIADGIFRPTGDTRANFRVALPHPAIPRGFAGDVDSRKAGIGGLAQRAFHFAEAQVTHRIVDAAAQAGNQHTAREQAHEQRTVD